MTRRWDDDEVLLADLGAAVEATRPLTPLVVEQGVGAFAWRTVDDDLVLAEMSFDSSAEPVGAFRDGSSGHRTVAFTAPPLSVELEVGPSGVLGQIVPPASGRLRIETAQGEVIVVDSDEHGFFALSHPLPDCPVRLRCETDTGRLVTDWVRP